MPPHVDAIERLRQAIVAIIGGLTAVQTITGRVVDNCVAWSAVAEAPRPTVAFACWLVQNGESGDGRDGTVQFTAVAEGNNADRVVNELCAAIEAGFTSEALFAQGVDGAPMNFTRRDGDSGTEDADPDAPRDNTRNMYTALLEVPITLTHT